MATPSDLISHYSSQAFATRISALTFAGAVLAAIIRWKSAESETNLIGLALVAVVGSLGELNRRYTHSYLAACCAAALKVPKESDEIASAMRWDLFSKINEWPWSTRPSPIFKWSPLKGPARRFLLSWLTYLPGLLVGVIIIFHGRISILGCFGIILAALFLLRWFILSLRELDPDRIREIGAAILSPDSEPQ